MHKRVGVRFIKFCCISIFSVLVQLLQAQHWHTTDSLIEAGIISANLYEQYLTQGNMLPASGNFLPELPLTLYSKVMQSVQSRINSNVSHQVVTHVDDSKLPTWLPHDSLAITPLNWIWIDFYFIQNTRDTSFVSLRRPYYWLPAGKKVGDSLLVSMPEMGIVGWTRITNIRKNQLDSRILSTGSESQQPITGKFVHHSNDVIEIYFTNQTRPLEVTSNHLIWSLDKNDWITASSLKAGERVKCHSKTMVVKSNRKKPDIQVVYNIEVFRDHNYYAGIASVLAHNTCLADYLASKVEKLVLGKGHVIQLPAKRTQIFTNEMNKGVFRTNYGLNVSPTVGATDQRILAAMDEIVARNGEIVMILDDVNMDAARRGFGDFWADAVGEGHITEWELATILRNRKYYDRTKVSKNGQVVPISEVEDLKYIESSK